MGTNKKIAIGVLVIVVGIFILLNSRTEMTEVIEESEQIEDENSFLIVVIGIGIAIGIGSFILITKKIPIS